jgi:hypothetical protein
MGMPVPDRCGDYCRPGDAVIFGGGMTTPTAVTALAGAAILSSGTAAAADPGPIGNEPVVGRSTIS